MGFVVAIDGPAGSGKGTITKLIADKMNLVSIDTGAMYRCVTLYMIDENIETTDMEKIKQLLENIEIELRNENGTSKVYLNNKDVTKQIRTQKVTELTSVTCKIKEVRDKMTELQRSMGERQNIIMEGRDIGTAVFPNADVKIYLDAKPEERARRRYEQNKEIGLTGQTYEEILESVRKRDYNDSTREISPLKKADDAILVDSTNLTIEEVVEKIIGIIKDVKK
ncbi:MAG: (d)CMP kinase [Clostridia bacterium]|nr:(d)CMP kinase [Clostridia bacterium]